MTESHGSWANQPILVRLPTCALVCVTVDKNVIGLWTEVSVQDTCGGVAHGSVWRKTNWTADGGGSGSAT